jgi:hypothetical protein
MRVPAWMIGWSGPGSLPSLAFKMHLLERIPADWRSTPTLVEAAEWHQRTQFEGRRSCSLEAVVWEPFRWECSRSSSPPACGRI